MLSSVALLCEVEADFEDGLGDRPDVFESGLDGLILNVTVMNALDDRGEIGWRGAAPTSGRITAVEWPGIRWWRTCAAVGNLRSRV